MDIVTRFFRFRMIEPDIDIGSRMSRFRSDNKD
jgi:hypothetical protein